MARIGTKSFTLEYGIFREGARETVVATGSSVVVWTDYAEGRSRAIPDGLREALNRAALP